jgi:hypothetical protein
MAPGFRRVIRAAALCAALAAASTLSRAQRVSTIPDSLSDQEFWRLFTTMSEESGTFPSENFVSNEKTYQFVIPTLERTLTPNGVYVGVGPEQNFTYIANLEPRLAMIVDIRRQNAMQHLMYKALFELSPTRGEFVSRLFSRPLPPSVPRTAPPADIFAAISDVPANDSAFAANWKAIVDRLRVTHGFALSRVDSASMHHVFRAFFEAGPDISYAYHLGAPPTPTAWLVTFGQLQTLTNVEGENMAFLATDERYTWLRSFESRNLVVPVVGDFAGPKAIRAVGDYVRAHDAIVTAFYCSNVEQYLFTGLGLEKAFYRNVATLPIDSTSTFIRSLPAPSAPMPPLPSLAFNLTRVVVSTDSTGVRTVTASGTDSTGKAFTTSFVAPAAPMNTLGAFVSGTAPVRRVLEAFLAGQLDTYPKLTAVTKTDFGWKPVPP